MPIDSPVTSYSDTTPQKRVITDVISLIDPADTPLLDALGGLDGASGKFRFVNNPGTVMEWLEDTLFPLTDSLNGSIATNTTAVTVADASKFQDGDILLVDAEYVWVSAVNTATEVITVTRNYGGTQATHATSAVVEIVGQARLEGDDSDARAFTDRTTASNFTEIFHHEVKVTRTQNKLTQYGIDEELEYQARKIIPSINRLIEKAQFHGQQKAGSATTPRAFGGLGTFITANTVSAGGAVTQADFDDTAQLIFADGGMGPWLAPCSPANVKVIKSFLESSTILRVTQSETQLGMIVDKIVTPFGDVAIQRNRWAPSAKIYLVDPNHAGFVTYDPFRREPLAKSGDYEREEVVGEFSYAVRQGNAAHGAITAIS